MTIMQAATGRTILDQIIIDLEAADEKIDGMLDRAGSLTTYTPESGPWPAEGCPWGAQLVDGALASAQINAALRLLRQGRDAMQAAQASSERPEQ